MILVTVSGYPGSGTTTVVAHLRGLLGVPSFNIGDAFRSLAAERGLTLAELHLEAKADRSIDRTLDDRQVEVARAGNVIMEGRLAGFLTHRAGLDATRVWLRAPLPVRAGRVARREGIPVARAEEEIRIRQETERTRYLDFYGFDLDDPSIYGMVVESDREPAEDIARRIAEKARSRP